MLAGTAQSLFLLAVVIGAAIFDWKTRRIPNVLNFVAIGVGIGLWVAVGSMRQALLAFVTAVVVIAVGMVLQAAGILGGGDVKLLGAVAAIGGPSFLGEALFWTLVVGVASSLVILARRKKLFPLFRRLGSALRAVLWKLMPEPVVEGEGHRMPYGIVIAAGCILALIAVNAGYSISQGLQ